MKTKMRVLHRHAGANTRASAAHLNSYELIRPGHDEGLLGLKNETNRTQCNDEGHEDAVPASLGVTVADRSFSDVKRHIQAS